MSRVILVFDSSVKNSSKQIKVFSEEKEKEAIDYFQEVLKKFQEPSPKMCMIHLIDNHLILGLCDRISSEFKDLAWIQKLEAI